MQYQRAEFGVRELVDMIFDGLADTGLVPPNLRTWASDREWALRTMPTFRPPEDGWENRPVKFEDELGPAQVTQSPEQRFIRIRVPWESEPQPLFALYRSATMCWRDHCASPFGLRWVLEGGRDGYATACERCNVVTWKHEVDVPHLVRVHLANLVDVKQLAIVPVPSLWLPLHGRGHVLEEAPQIEVASKYWSRPG